MSDSSISSDLLESRVARRRAGTRARLLSAAQRLAGDDGSVTVAQIAAEADIALASFYTHFDSKDALFAELVAQIMEGLAARFRRHTEEEDSAVAVAAALREFWLWFAEEPSRARFVLHTAQVNRLLAQTLGATLAVLIDRGRQNGRFVVSSTESAAYMIGGGIIGATNGYTQGHLAGPTLDVALAAQALQLLGLTPDAARQAATAARPNHRSS